MRTDFGKSVIEQLSHNNIPALRNSHPHIIYSTSAHASSASAKYLLANRPFMAAVAPSAALVYSSPMSKQATQRVILSPSM